MHRITIERRGTRRPLPPDAPALAKPDAPAGGADAPARSTTVHLPRRDLLTVPAAARPAELGDMGDPSKVAPLATPAERLPDRTVRDKAAEEAEIRERARQAARETLRPLLSRPKPAAAAPAEPVRPDALPKPQAASPEPARGEASRGDTSRPETGRTHGARAEPGRADARQRPGPSPRSGHAAPSTQAAASQPATRPIPRRPGASAPWLGLGR